MSKTILNFRKNKNQDVCKFIDAISLKYYLRASVVENI